MHFHLADMAVGKPATRVWSKTGFMVGGPIAPIPSDSPGRVIDTTCLWLLYLLSFIDEIEARLAYRTVTRLQKSDLEVVYRAATTRF